MASPVVLLFGIAVIYLVFRHLTRTDTPFIKNLPEIPGVPIFGNLLQLGEHHAKVTQQWASKYGPVFQTRLGNKVGVLDSNHDFADRLLAGRLCKLIRLGAASVDHSPVRSNLSTDAAHLSYRSILLRRLYHWYESVGRVMPGQTKGCRYRPQPTCRSVIHAIH